MAEMLSPGVYITEIDASTIVPTVSNSIAVYGGKFDKGPVGMFTLITSVADLITYYGSPSNSNYNDFYQAYNFLQYGNKLLISRAANVGGSAEEISGVVLTNSGDYDVTVSSLVGLSVGDYICFDDDVEGGADLSNVYMITALDTDNLVVTVDRFIDQTLNIEDFNKVYSVQQSMNAVFEAVDNVVVGEAVSTDSDYLGKMMVIENASDFETKETSIAFVNENSKLKFIGRNPGNWANDVEIAIATPSAFGTDTASYAFDGIALDDLFEYAPTGTEVGIIIKVGSEIKEIWTVDFDQTAKDHNNKSTYIETVINNGSSYVFVKDNTANSNDIKDYCFSVNGVEGTVAQLVMGTDSEIQEDDLLNAYEIFNNKEEIDIDIVIGNEVDYGKSAKELVNTRKDCIAFIGAEYGDVVGKKSATAVSNLINWRKTGNVNYNNMFVVACGNYKYQYDRYNDKYRWINIAGDIAGLRAQTSMNRASWYACNACHAA